MEQLRQLIEGRLIAMGKEPMNVQILVTGAAETPALQDEGGSLPDGCRQWYGRGTFFRRGFP